MMPDDKNTNERTEAEAEALAMETAQQEILMQMMFLVKSRATKISEIFTAEDLALVTTGTRTQYKKSNYRASKVKGGNPPPDYTGVEALVDLIEELKKEAPDYKLVFRNYLMLRALLKA